MHSGGGGGKGGMGKWPKLGHIAQGSLVANTSAYISINECYIHENCAFY